MATAKATLTRNSHATYRARGVWTVAKWVGFYAVLVIVSCFWVFPVVWVFLTSIKPDPIIVLMPPVWTFEPTFGHYTALFTDYNFGLFFLNSAVIAVGSTLLSISTGALAAYAIVRHRIGGASLRLGVLGVRMLPPAFIALPLLVIFQSLKLGDSVMGLVLAHTAFLTPFAIWLLAGFFQGLPKEVEEAAMIDGCSRLDVLFRIVLPMTRPSVAATAVLALVFSWNDLFYALMLSTQSTKTLPVAVTAFITHYNIKWGDLSAASMITLMPPVVFCLLVQQHLVRGLTLGAVK